MGKYISTTATKRIFSLGKRIRFVSGGTSSSKTISILIWLIAYAQTEKNKIVSVVSESLPHLKKAAIRDFLDILVSHCYFKEDRWNKTESIYTFETGSIIEFFGAEQLGKVHGPRRDVLFVNEGNNVPYSVFLQLEIRTRELIWVDSNPTHEYWMYTDVIPNNDIDFITVTYLENEALDKSIVASIESKKYNRNFWQVYGEGKLGTLESRIYSNWDICDDVPEGAKLVRYGLDFGYQDPSALVAVWRWNGVFIFDQMLYGKGLSNRKLAEAMQDIRKDSIVVADSAEPKSIDEIRTWGIPIVGAAKGPGSVSQGIQLVQDLPCAITRRSVDIIREYRGYCWETDRDGKILNAPQGFDDHSMSAIRYALSYHAQEWHHAKARSPDRFPKGRPIKDVMREDGILSKKI